MKRFLAVLLTFALTAPVYAQTNADRRDKTWKGAAIGAVAGGVLGAVVGNNRGSGDAKNGAIKGAVIGAVAGTTIGVMMDKQERELRQIEGIDVRRTADDEIDVVVRNEVLFAFDSAALRSASRTTLQDMAEVFNRYGNTTLSIEGHTDSVGSAAYNRGLSQRRANSVASYLGSLGLDGYRLDTIAYGESQPRSSNSTASGRQMNRRVEIRVKAERG